MPEDGSKRCFGSTTMETVEIELVKPERICSRKFATVVGFIPYTIFWPFTLPSSGKPAGGFAFWVRMSSTKRYVADVSHCRMLSASGTAARTTVVPETWIGPV